MKVIVIGGGPAGMLAAISSKEAGNDVTILEKMNSLGKKLLITGKGRCNITNAIDISEFIKNIPGNGKFLYSAFQNFDNKDIIELLDIPTKVERGNRVFPQSDKSVDVLNALLDLLRKNNIKIETNCKVEEIVTSESGENCKTEKVATNAKINKLKTNSKIEIAEKAEMFETTKVANEAMKEEKTKKVIGVKTNKGYYEADKVILATGGASYQATGSTGDGYIIAKNLGHTITKIRPSLVSLKAKGKYQDICGKLQGLSLKNVSIKLLENNKKIYEDFGEMLFTHFGVSGPIILSSSAHLRNTEMNNVKIIIDFKPALDFEKLDARILRDFEQEKNKSFKNSLNDLLPQKLIPVIVALSKIDENKKVNEITKQERGNLAKLLKNFEVEIEDFGNINEAIVTSGGINIKEINPKTMESKLVKGLFFAGEVIDVDGYTGGFNLQIAYSTGYTAGLNES